MYFCGLTLSVELLMTCFNIYIQRKKVYDYAAVFELNFENRRISLLAERYTKGKIPLSVSLKSCSQKLDRVT